MENVPDSKKAALDSMAVHFHKRHRQTCRKLYPATDFSNGITTLTNILGCRTVWASVSLCYLVNLWRGMADFGYNFAEKDHHQPPQGVLKPCFVLMPGSECQRFWSVDQEQQGKLDAVASIRKLMQMCKSRIPTDNSARWNFPKFHELLHIVEDIVRFWAPINYSAKRLHGQGQCWFQQQSNLAGDARSATTDPRMNDKQRNVCLHRLWLQQCTTRYLFLILTNGRMMENP